MCNLFEQQYRIYREDLELKIIHSNSVPVWLYRSQQSDIELFYIISPRSEHRTIIQYNNLCDTNDKLCIKLITMHECDCFSQFGSCALSFCLPFSHNNEGMRERWNALDSNSPQIHLLIQYVTVHRSRSKTIFSYYVQGIDIWMNMTIVTYMCVFIADACVRGWIFRYKLNCCERIDRQPNYAPTKPVNDSSRLADFSLI